MWPATVGSIWPRKPRRIVACPTYSIRSKVALAWPHVYSQFGNGSNALIAQSPWHIPQTKQVMDSTPGALSFFESCVHGIHVRFGSFEVSHMTSNLSGYSLQDTQAPHSNKTEEVWYNIIMIMLQPKVDTIDIRLRNTDHPRDNAADEERFAEMGCVQCPWTRLWFEAYISLHSNAAFCVSKSCSPSGSGTGNCKGSSRGLARFSYVSTACGKCIW